MKSPSVILFVASSLWGLYWLPLRAIEVAGVTSTWSVAFFNVCPLIVLIPYLLWNRQTQLRHLRAVAVIGLFTGIGLSFYASGLVYSSVIRVTLLFYLTPIWSTIIGVLWLSEKLRPDRIVAIILGLGGLWLLLAANDGAAQPLNVGDGMALLSGVFWGIGAACMKKWPMAPTAATATGKICRDVGVLRFSGRRCVWRNHAGSGRVCRSVSGGVSCVGSGAFAQPVCDILGLKAGFPRSRRHSDDVRSIGGHRQCQPVAARRDHDILAMGGRRDHYRGLSGSCHIPSGSMVAS